MTGTGLRADHDNVLLLAPSAGLGGGIERYVATVEAAFARCDVPYRRLDLMDADRRHGVVTKVRFAREARRALRASSSPTRLVVALCNLLPVVRLVSDLPQYAGATVILHGRELWCSGPVRGHRMMRRPDVRVVAASNFSAGALAPTCRANVLHPGVSAAWYDTLVSAGTRATRRPGELHLVTAFRLGSWRDKGLGTLLAAIGLLDDPRVRLTVCGNGPVPADLRATLERLPWCRVRSGLTDQQLAQQLADADLFVLATRTRRGSDSSGEGFGLVLLEAQLAGTPVVTPAYGGSGEAFEPGLTGLAPLDETPEALAAVLDALLRDQCRRAEMGRAAAAWSRARFEPAAHSRHLVRMLLGDPEPPRDRPAASGLRPTTAQSTVRTES
jgi:glycosyltransferase involved in cell wall biosynthesis